MLRTIFSRLGSVVAIVVLLLLRSPEAATARTYSVERAGSEIKFQVKSRLKVIEGVFENWKAQIDLDPARLEALQLAGAGTIRKHQDRKPL